MSITLPENIKPLFHSNLEHVFFDLDHTLWDTEANSKKALELIFEECKTDLEGSVKFDEFLPVYTKINHQLWDDYAKGLVNKEELRIDRFKNSFAHFNFDKQDVLEHFAYQFVSITPKQGLLIDGAIEILERLNSKFQLHIITNGFKEAQFVKLEYAGLSKYFKEVILSEDCGIMKPNPEIFHYSSQRAKSTNLNSLYIGDNYKADVLGAKAANWNVIHFNEFDLVENSVADATVKKLVDIYS